MCQDEGEFFYDPPSAVLDTDLEEPAVMATKKLSLEMINKEGRSRWDDVWDLKP